MLQAQMMYVRRIIKIADEIVTKRAEKNPNEQFLRQKCCTNESVNSNLEKGFHSIVFSLFKYYKKGIFLSPSD